MAGLLDDGFERGRAAWPSVVVTATEFGRYVLERLDNKAPPEEQVRGLRLEDLYLACACARGDAAALATLEKVYIPEVVATVTRKGLSPSIVEDALQRLRVRLFVREGNAPARIAGYMGRGDLLNWLRVAAVRDALHLKRQDQREAGGADAELDEAALARDQPELTYLKEENRADFNAAFAAAVAELTSRERNLLRYHYLEGLTLDKLARMHRVHRATVARWLSEAREAILERTQALLRECLDLTESEAESLVRLMRSRLDVSLADVLAAPSKRGPR